MVTETNVKSFMSACKAYFGLRPQQDLRSFLAEVNQLSPEDKEEIAKGLDREGVHILDQPF